MADVFGGFSKFGASLIAFLLIGVGVLIGSFFLFVPGLVFGLLMAFTFHAIAIDDEDAIDPGPPDAPAPSGEKTSWARGLMVTLLMAIPFGTLVYLARYADFDTTKAAAILGTLMFLKVVLVIALVIAHERFLLNCGFIVLMATSFIAMIIVTFLHNFPPGFLVSITDGIAAIIVSILAIIWGIIFLIGGVIGIVNMIKGTIL